MARRQRGLAETREPASTPASEERPTRRPWRRSLYLVLAIIAAVVTYAYAFEKTDVNLDAIKDERRQESLFSVLRALAQPDLLTYESTETIADLEFMVPCPAGGFTPGPIEGEHDFSVEPECAEPRDQVVVTGTGFGSNEQVRVFFVPPNGTELRVADLRTDSNGSFEETIRLPNRPDDAIQTIRVKSEQPVGSIFSPVFVTDAEGERVRSPRWSQNAVDTLDKIIETVFLAFLATTAGTLIAIPLSFFAAKNLMRDVTIPAFQLGLALIGIPVGVFLGLGASGYARNLVETLPESAWAHGVVVLALAWVTLTLLRIAVPQPGTTRPRRVRIVAALAAGIAILIAGQSLAEAARHAGTWFVANTAGLDFLGNFVATLGEILATAFGLFAAIAGAAVVALVGSKFGYAVGKRVSSGVSTILTVIAMAVAGAIVALGVGRVVTWLYQLDNIRATVTIPAIVGALIGGLLAWRGLARGQLGAGIGVYYLARTVFNTLRSIEPLVMVIVFVIWVGLGAFAGALALGLHTIAALTKLYSEQVESINTGPLEAVRATGATRLQTVVYGVVPQIVAPYISFTMYRWDINVRMSTIIGFGGGGGIGFLLQQNIGLLRYRSAAAQMLAIAIVVASMDYISSRLRERYT